jgi:hypothetical protein
MSEDELTAGTLIDGARMYAAAADAVNDKLPNTLHVLTHLLGMSIELALKAFLRHFGYSEKQLIRIGHDLGALLDRAIQHGLVDTGSRNFVLNVAGHNYRQRLFAYPRQCNMNVIMPWRLRQMADELINETFIAIKGNEVFEAHKNSPGLCIKSSYPNDLEASAWAELACNGTTKDSSEL